MNGTGKFKLLHRLLALGTLTAALIVVGYMSPSNSARAQSQTCEPCNGCTPDAICAPCGLHAKPTDSFCADGLRLYTCGGVCKPPGGSCSGDMPFCEGIESPVCNGGAWECDNAPNNQCSGAPPSCTNGYLCYGGEYYCANGNGCSGSPPTCPDQSSAVCNSGLWYCP